MKYLLSPLTFSATIFTGLILTIFSTAAMLLTGFALPFGYFLTILAQFPGGKFISRSFLTLLADSLEEPSKLVRDNSFEISEDEIKEKD